MSELYKEKNREKHVKNLEIGVDYICGATFNSPYREGYMLKEGSKFRVIKILEGRDEEVHYAKLDVEGLTKKVIIGVAILLRGKIFLA